MLFEALLTVTSVLCLNLYIHELLYVIQSFTYSHFCENPSYNTHYKWHRSQSHQSRLDFRKDRQEDNLHLYSFFHPGSSKSMYSLALNTTTYGQVSISTKTTLNTDKLKSKTKQTQQNTISWMTGGTLVAQTVNFHQPSWSALCPSPNSCPWGTKAYSWRVTDTI